MEARGPSAAAARRNLQVRLQKRSTPRKGLIATTDKISQLADLYLLELDRSDKASRTKDKYSFSVKKYITPALGSIRIGEATSGVIDYFIRDVVDNAGPATARTCGAVMGVEAAAYQASHSKVSMSKKHYIEEYKEALDTRGALSAFNPDPPKPPGMGL